MKALEGSKMLNSASKPVSTPTHQAQGPGGAGGQVHLVQAGLAIGRRAHRNQGGVAHVGNVKRQIGQRPQAQ